MVASVFEPSGAFIARLEIQDGGELPEKLQALVASGKRIPMRSYVELPGQSWTIVGFSPIQLKEGSAPVQARADASARSRRYKSRTKEDARGQMMSGLVLCGGGLAFSVASFFIATGLGASKFLVASGAIFWGGFRFLKGFTRLRGR